MKKSLLVILLAVSMFGFCQIASAKLVSHCFYLYEGESLDSLAIIGNCSPEQVRKWNPRVKPDYWDHGDTIYLCCQLDLARERRAQAGLRQDETEAREMARIKPVVNSVNSLRADIDYSSAATIGEVRQFHDEFTDYRQSSIQAELDRAREMAKLKPKFRLTSTYGWRDGTGDSLVLSSVQYNIRADLRVMGLLVLSLSGAWGQNSGRRDFNAGRTAGYGGVGIGLETTHYQVLLGMQIGKSFAEPTNARLLANIGLAIGDFRLRTATIAHLDETEKLLSDIRATYPVWSPMNGRLVFISGAEYSFDNQRLSPVLKAATRYKAHRLVAVTEVGFWDIIWFHGGIGIANTNGHNGFYGQAAIELVIGKKF